MEERIKQLEIEVAYLRKSIEEMKEAILNTPLETHTHYYFIQLGDKYLEDNNFKM